MSAYKTVELDQSLGGEPVQHREVQGHETVEFLSLWANGIQYMAGGIETGFKHVDRDSFQTRLLHIKGRRNIRVMQVQLNPSALNSGDVFILDAGRELFQWNGKESTNVEKQKALEVVRKIRDEERSGKANITVVEEGTKEDAFWAAFGQARPNRIKSSADGGEDDAVAKTGLDSIFLYRVSNSTGKMVATEIPTKPFKKDMLDTNDAFILDTGSAGIFVWVGKKSNNDEKLHSMKMAQDFIKSKGYPDWTPITRVAENGETPLFKQNFFQWPERDATGLGGIGVAGKKKQFLKKQFSAASLATRGRRESQALVDDGKGTIEIWRIENFKKEPVPKEQYGHFYGGDSYIILYTYFKNDKKMFIIYFWQGLKSSQDEKGASALLTVALDDEMKARPDGGDPTQVRVVQNKEPDHFNLLFKGKMVGHEGGHASGFKNVHDVDRYDTDGTRLFQVKGTNEFNTRAIQVPERAASLNSGDVFILETPSKVWLWCGKSCSGDEREAAKNISKSVASREYTMIQEGAEPADFWEALGGKTAYAEVKEAAGQESKEPRLFQCTNAVGESELGLALFRYNVLMLWRRILQGGGDLRLRPGGPDRRRRDAARHVQRDLHLGGQGRQCRGEEECDADCH